MLLYHGNPIVLPRNATHYQLAECREVLQNSQPYPKEFFSIITRISQDSAIALHNWYRVFQQKAAVK